MKRWCLAVAVITAVAVATTPFAYGAGHSRLHGDRQECCGRGIGPTAGDEGFGLAPGGHLSRRLARYLDLSQEQTDKIVELQKKFGPQTKTLRDDLFQKRVEARSLYADPNADEGTILAKQGEIGNLEQKLRDDTVQLRLEQRRILTPEQLKKLAEFKPRHDGHRRGKLLG